MDHSLFIIALLLQKSRGSKCNIVCNIMYLYFVSSSNFSVTFCKFPLLLLISYVPIINHILSLLGNVNILSMTRLGRGLDSLSQSHG